MPYQPTGNPPGRPRKDGTPAKPAEPKTLSEALAAKPDAPPIQRSALDHRPIEAGHVSPCRECFPHVGRDWNALACQHGSWVNRR